MSTGPRHQAREAALQVLYFCQVGKVPPHEAIDAFFVVHQPEASDEIRAFAAEIVHGTAADAVVLDGLIERQSQHWRLERIAIIDRLILRMAVWELRRGDETPVAVVMNEALELARTFSSDASVKFVNGVLDGIRKTIQADN